MNRRDAAFLAGPVQATRGRSARSGARVEEGQRGRGDGSPCGHTPAPFVPRPATGHLIPTSRKAARRHPSPEAWPRDLWRAAHRHGTERMAQVGRGDGVPVGPNAFWRTGLVSGPFTPCVSEPERDGNAGGFSQPAAMDLSSDGVNEVAVRAPP